MKLTIGVINYNTEIYINSLLESIRHYPPHCSFEIIVVDNASTDNSLKTLKKISGIKIIRNLYNMGFSKACNQISKIAKGDYLLFLNPDVIVTEGAIDRMLKFADKHKECGVIGGKLLDFDGEFQYSCREFPNIFNVFFGRESLLRKIFPNNPISRKYMLYDVNYNETQYVDWLRGAVMLTPLELYKKLGGMDEEFFLFLEDTEYCYRIKKNGRQVCYFPEAVFYHKLGASTKQIMLRAKIEHNVSMYRYLRKIYDIRYPLLFFLGLALLLRILVIHFWYALYKMKGY